MLIKKDALIGICLIIYLAVWLALVWVYLFKVYHSKRINVQKAYRSYFITVFIRHWGWFGAVLLLVFLQFTIPTVGIVTQDLDRKIAQEKALEKKYDWFHADSTYNSHSTFFYDEYYFLFSYKGRKSFGKNFIHNRTDSVLNTYKTKVALSGPLSVENDGIFIAPGELRDLPFHLDSKFDPPSGYLKKKEIYKDTWTLDTKESAQYQKNAINDKIERNKNLNRNAIGF